MRDLRQVDSPFTHAMIGRKQETAEEMQEYRMTVTARQANSRRAARVGRDTGAR
jgi:hypothetical protein